ncbi:lytic murein transglycosylase [Nocardioides sp. TF02-7]|uniref:lytic transglycosylase domain-containing protein n=1 Tax=Nocardioides sp. TF02-7 TaxID=2917724 RepID=UPI001F05147D|nr:lytic murein transglycosylase [Nocardioides sp. TF02-7]UMG93849.1 lytic murein transglycosylase [Nocardioides sp. TF02-7]
MSRKRLGRLQRAATIVPLALLSAAWTASVAGIGGVPTVASAEEQQPETSLPDGTSVPNQAIEAPASVSDADSLTGGNDQTVVATASTNQIPSAALAAYQRAETVINAADKSCKLTWQLVAAIGRVESNHGRYGGNVLDDDGVAQPGIFGVPLNGKRGTKAISDTDGGQFDGDTQWDRAIGPMQFIPSTWSVVGVDADNDSKRNPQDIDDAALASAVYLCSGNDDLSTVVGQRAAVHRYNHSQSYVDLVLSIMDAYLEGDFSTIPNNTTSAGYIVPQAPTYNPGSHDTGSGDKDRAPNPAGDSSGTDDDGGDVTPPTQPEDETPGGGNDNGGGNDDGGNNGGGNDNGGGGNKGPLGPVTDGLEEVAPDLWTVAEATVECTTRLLDNVTNPLGLNLTRLLQQLGLLDDRDACVDRLAGTPQN